MAEMKVNVAAGIAPYTDNDKYPTHFALYGKGGYRSVPTLSDMYNIPEERVEVGMLVYVEEMDRIYIYKSSGYNDTENPNDNENGGTFDEEGGGIGR